MTNNIFLLGITTFVLCLNLGSARNLFAISAQAPVIKCFACIIQQGYDTILVEIQGQGGVFSQNAKQNIVSAKADGLQIEILLFPNQNQPVDTQIDATLGYLKQNLLKYSFLWFEVINDEQWQDSPLVNEDFLADLMEASLAYTSVSEIGVYTNQTSWNSIMGNSANFEDFPLLWVQYDGLKSYDSFVPFCGWQAPSLKQYSYQQQLCCIAANLDWQPQANLRHQNRVQSIREIGWQSIKRQQYKQYKDQNQ